MARLKCSIILFLLLAGSQNIKAAYKSDIYTAYISNNMAQWERIIIEMNLQKVKNNDFVLELLNYQYGYIAWCLGNGKDDLARQYLDLGEKNLQTLKKSDYKSSMINAYQSAFYGFRISLNKYKAPFLGPKSLNCAEQAIALDASNPFGYIQYANAQYHTPAIFGGSKEVALTYFTKAEKLMEANPAQIKDDWNYLSLLKMIARTYSELKNDKMSKVYYEKILKTEPNFSLIKDKLF